MIKTLDAGAFRRKLAGLCDATEGEEMNAEDYRELAGDFVLLLAICFNRKSLDAKTIWTRIDSAIQKGLADCDGEDISQFTNTCLEHVMASVNVVAAQEDCICIQTKLYGLEKQQAVFLLQYLAKHRMPAIVWGRERWENRKEEINAQKAMLEIEEARKEEVGSLNY